MVQKRVEVNPAPAGADVFIVASSLPLKSYGGILPFLRMSGRVEGQLKRTPGLVRYGLMTDLPRKRFWTLTVWTSRDAMKPFIRTGPHAEAIAAFARWGAGGSFAEWTSKDPSLNWTEALRRLENPTRWYQPPGAPQKAP